MMDNASFHYMERLEQMCLAFIKKIWQAFEDSPEQGFGAFLEWCIDVVGGREGSAKSHFKHAGLIIEEL
jgi:hypothetical protein